jgi:SPP1 family predicted phage head-tail adaptor
MRIGALDRQILLQRATVTYEGPYNEPVHTWATIATAWAEVRRTPGREFLSLSQVVAERRATFVIRYRDVLPTDRILFEDEAWNVQDSRELGRREYLEISAVAVDNDEAP